MSTVSVQRTLNSLESHGAPPTTDMDTLTDSGTGTSTEDEETSKPSSRRLSECYFAVALPPNPTPHPPRVPPLSSPSSSSSSSDIQRHLQSMFEVLRPQETLKMAVKLESVHPDRTRYLVVVSCDDQGEDESCLLGIDCNQTTTVGLVLRVLADTSITLDGDGGFSVCVCNRQHIFKPVSVQAMWSALQSLHKVSSVARDKNYFLNGDSHEWVTHYETRVASDRSCLNEWHAMDSLESRRPPSPDSLRDKPSQRDHTEAIIRNTLKEIIMSVDLDEVTSKYIRSRLEDIMNSDLGEYKSFIDQEMFNILKQMDAATEIFPHVFLGSEWNASNLEELAKNGVGHILNVTREIDNFFPGIFDYKNVRVYDDDKTDLLLYWDDTYKYITNAKNQGSKVLVHCKMGISRSASVVIAYAMKAYGWELNRAMAHVRQKRNCIKPNANFIAQLETYQGILDAMKNREKLQRSKSETNLKSGGPIGAQSGVVGPGGVQQAPGPLSRSSVETRNSSEAKEEAAHAMLTDTPPPSPTLLSPSPLLGGVCIPSSSTSNSGPTSLILSPTTGNTNTSMTSGVELAAGGSRPKSWSPDAMQASTLFETNAPTSQSLERLPPSPSLLLPTPTTPPPSSCIPPAPPLPPAPKMYNVNVLACANGLAYSVSQNKVLHLAGTQSPRTCEGGVKRRVHALEANAQVSRSLAPSEQRLSAGPSQESPTQPKRLFQEKKSPSNQQNTFSTTVQQDRTSPKNTKSSSEATVSEKKSPGQSAQQPKTTTVVSLTSQFEGPGSNQSSSSGQAVSSSGSASSLVKPPQQKSSGIRKFLNLTFMNKEKNQQGASGDKSVGKSCCSECKSCNSHGKSCKSGHQRAEKVGCSCKCGGKSPATNVSSGKSPTSGSVSKDAIPPRLRGVSSTGTLPSPCSGSSTSLSRQNSWSSQDSAIVIDAAACESVVGRQNSWGSYDSATATGGGLRGTTARTHSLGSYDAVESYCEGCLGGGGCCREDHCTPGFSLRSVKGSGNCNVNSCHCHSSTNISQPLDDTQSTILSDTQPGTSTKCSCYPNTDTLSSTTSTSSGFVTGGQSTPRSVSVYSAQQSQGGISSRPFCGSCFRRNSDSGGSTAEMKANAAVNDQYTLASREKGGALDRESGSRSNQAADSKLMFEGRLSSGDGTAVGRTSGGGTCYDSEKILAATNCISSVILRKKFYSESSGHASSSKDSVESQTSCSGGRMSGDRKSDSDVVRQGNSTFYVATSKTSPGDTQQGSTCEGSSSVRVPPRGNTTNLLSEHHNASPTPPPPSRPLSQTLFNYSNSYPQPFNASSSRLKNHHHHLSRSYPSVIGGQSQLSATISDSNAAPCSIGDRRSTGFEQTTLRESRDPIGAFSGSSQVIPGPFSEKTDETSPESCSLLRESRVPRESSLVGTSPCDNLPPLVGVGPSLSGGFRHSSAGGAVFPACDILPPCESQGHPPYSVTMTTSSQSLNSAGGQRAESGPGVRRESPRRSLSVEEGKRGKSHASSRKHCRCRRENSHGSTSSPSGTSGEKETSIVKNLKHEFEAKSGGGSVKHERKHSSSSCCSCGSEGGSSDEKSLRRSEKSHQGGVSNEKSHHTRGKSHHHARSEGSSKRLSDSRVGDNVSSVCDRVDSQLVNDNSALGRVTPSYNETNNNPTQTNSKDMTPLCDINNQQYTTGQQDIGQQKSPVGSQTQNVIRKNEAKTTNKSGAFDNSAVKKTSSVVPAMSSGEHKKSVRKIVGKFEQKTESVEVGRTMAKASLTDPGVKILYIENTSSQTGKRLRDEAISQVLGVVGDAGVTRDTQEDDGVRLVQQGNVVPPPIYNTM
uniref:protein-serine/threonine phosphatase n=1 Tax=Cacopsylla melanoneura TaxID=428564 RepID=A0A8D8LKD3_9HEMI